MHTTLKMTEKQIPPAPYGFKANVQQHLGFNRVEEEKRKTDKSHTVCKLCHTTNDEDDEPLRPLAPRVGGKDKKKNLPAPTQTEHHNKAANPVREAEVKPCFAKDLGATSTACDILWIY